MTEFDACVKVLKGYRDNYDEIHSRLLAECREAKSEGWHPDAIDELVEYKREVAIKRNLLDLILDNLEDGVRNVLQDDAMKGR